MNVIESFQKITEAPEPLLYEPCEPNIPCSIYLGHTYVHTYERARHRSTRSRVTRANVFKTRKCIRYFGVGTLLRSEHARITDWQQQRNVRVSGARGIHLESTHSRGTLFPGPLIRFSAENVSRGQIWIRANHSG